MYSRRHSGGSGDCGDSGADFARGGRNAWCTFAALTANPIAAAVCAQRCRAADALAPGGRERINTARGEEEVKHRDAEDGELELGFGQGLYNGGLGVFRGGVARRCHFADEEVLRAFEHFLFAEGERLAAAERNETLEDDGNFEEGPGAHALGILFEAVLPVVMRVEFAGFEEAKDFGGFCGANNGTKANGHGI